MQSQFGKLTLVLALALAWFVDAKPSIAQKTHNQTVATVSFAGLNRLRQDARAFKKLAKPESGDPLAAISSLLSRPTGIDGDLPWGIVVQSSELIPVGFIPVNDLAATIETINGILPFTFQKIKGGYGAKTPYAKVYVKQIDNYAYFTHRPSILADLQKTPAELLGHLPEKYDLAIRMHPRLVPRAIKKKTSQLLSTTYRLPKATDTVKTINQFDEVSLAIAYDHQKNICQFTAFGITNTKSPLAAIVPELNPARTRFRGFFGRGHTFSFNSTTRTKIHSSLLDSAHDKLSEVILSAVGDSPSISKSYRETAKRTAADLLQTATKTLKSGNIDVAFNVDLVDDFPELLVAAKIQNVNQVRDAIYQLLARISASDDLIVSRREYQAFDIGFDHLTLQDRRPGQKGNIELFLGFDERNHSFYLGCGKRNLEKKLARSLTESDRRSTKKAPLRIAFSLDQLRQIPLFNFDHTGLFPATNPTRPTNVAIVAQAKGNRIHSQVILDQGTLAWLANHNSNSVADSQN